MRTCQSHSEYTHTTLPNHHVWLPRASNQIYLHFLFSLRFKNVIFDIVPGEEGGTFQVKARFMGVDMEKFPLKYQVSLG